MALRYWVGGTATWDATAGTKWSTTSGGSGGAAVPTSADDVYFDANSGNVTAPISGTRVCNSLSLSGFPGNISGGTVEVYGNLDIASKTLNTYIYLKGTSGTKNVTFGTGSMGILWITGAATFSLQSNLSVNNLFWGAGTITTNDYDVTITSGGRIDTDLAGGGTRVLNCGASTFNMIGSLSFAVTDGTLTVNPGTSNFIFSTNLTSLYGYGKSFNKVTIDGNAIVIGSDNSISELVINAGKKARIISGTTQTLGTLTSNGTVGSLAYLEAYTAGSAATITKASGTVSVSNMSIKDITATGGATWTASNSTNVSGNTGWNFITLYNLVCSVVSFSFVGKNNILKIVKTLVADVSSYILTGIDLLYNRALNMLISSVSFTLTGIDLLFNRVYNFTLDVKTYSLTGINTLFNRIANVVMSATSYSLTGINIAFINGKRLGADVANYILSVNDVYINRIANMVMVATSYSVTFIEFVFAKFFRIVSEGTSFVLTGVELSMTRIINIALTVISFVVTGTSTRLGRVLNFSIGIGEYALTGVNTLFNRMAHAVIDSTQFLLTGFSARIKGTRDFAWGKQQKDPGENWSMSTMDNREGWQITSKDTDDVWSKTQRN